MKRILIGAFLLVTHFALAQNADERAGLLMNKKDWFGLKLEYMASKDSLSPFIKDMSKALIDFHFNRLADAEKSIGDLLNNHQEVMGSDNAISMVYLLSDCYHRQEKNEDAANLMTEICSQLKAAQTDENTLSSFENLRDQYRELSRLNAVNELIRPNKDITIPLSIDTIRIKKEGLVIYINGTMNGKNGRFLFDTGAGVNAVSPQLAQEYGMRMVNVTTTATGVNTGNGGMAVADSIRMGEIVFRNVPFYVLDMTTGNKEVDKHISDLGIIIGIPIIEKLQEIQLDLANQQLIVPKQPASNPFPYSNLCFSDGRNLLGEVFTGKERLIMKFDSGASSSLLSSAFYTRNKHWIDNIGKLDSIRYAGFGGIHRDTVYCIPNLKIKVGPAEGILKEIDVSTRKQIPGEQEIDGVLGMDFFDAYSKIIINLKDMYIQAIGKPGNLSQFYNPGISPHFKIKAPDNIKQSLATTLLNLAYDALDCWYSNKYFDSRASRRTSTCETRFTDCKR